MRKLTTLPTDILSLPQRSRLKAGAHADVIVFDPVTIQGHATFERPHQLATGLRDVFINGKAALRDGEPTGEGTGCVVRGRAAEVDGGACKAAAGEWRWALT